MTIRSARAKVSRARQEIEISLSMFDQWMPANVRLARGADPDVAWAAVVAIVDLDPPDEAVVRGAESLTHLRSALDHIAFDAASRFAGARAGDKIYFPTARKRPNTGSTSSDWTRALPAAIQEAFTQFAKFDEPGGPWLWQLSQLSNHEKHEDFHAVGVVGGVRTFKFDDLDGGDISTAMAWPSDSIPLSRGTSAPLISAFAHRVGDESFAPVAWADVGPDTPSRLMAALENDQTLVVGFSARGVSAALWTVTDWVGRVSEFIDKYEAAAAATAPRTS